MVSGWPAITDICCVYVGCQFGPGPEAITFAGACVGSSRAACGCLTRAGMVSGWPAITDICCVYLPVEAGAV